MSPRRSVQSVQTRTVLVQASPQITSQNAPGLDAFKRSNGCRVADAVPIAEALGYDTGRRNGLVLSREAPTRS